MVNADLVNKNSSFDEVYSVLYEIGVEYDDRLENDPDFQLYYYVGEGPLKDFRDLRLKRLGQLLWNIGGLECMQIAYYSLPNNRALTMGLNALWDGIGDWVS